MARVIQMSDRDVDGAGSASDLPPPASIFGGWPGRSGVAQTRPAEQPQAWRGLPGQGAELGARALHRLRPDTGGGKIDGTSRSADWRRDAAAVDDGGGVVDRSPSQAPLPASATTTA